MEGQRSGGRAGGGDLSGARLSSEAEGAPYGYDSAEWNRFARQFTQAGVLARAWAKGYRTGVIASSDHGSTHISYAMVYTEDASREGILAAIRKRHTYAATDNIVLDLRMGDHMIGVEFKLLRAAPIRIRARGTAVVAKLEVIKDGRVVYTAEPRRQDVSVSFLDRSDFAGRHYYYVRLMQMDGMIAWSSPLFLDDRAR